MDNKFGKLSLLSDGGPEQEYELGKAHVTIGRATTNDITLSDSRVSRSHTRIDCSVIGCTLVDLGSANGTFVNGQRVPRALLKSGDVITLGGYKFRYDLSAPRAFSADMTVLNVEADLAQALDAEVLPYSINETQTPRLVVVTPRRTWEVPLEETDVLTIGRTDDNALMLEHPKVSRRHAEIQRKGSGFLLKDLGSTNGTWRGDMRLEQIVLQDGDEFRIGDAVMVFKNGFQEQELTLADSAMPMAAARRMVIFVPGIMGSEFWRGSDCLFPNVKALFTHPEVLSYPNPVEARKILQDVVIVPNLVKLDQYNRLGDYLVEELGYTRGADFFEFPYDWRQDLRLSAKQLGALVESLPRDRPLVIIGHSLGTLVSRYYIERLGGKNRVERVILMGGPHRGAVQALTSLLSAPELLPFGIMGERLRQVCMSFPSSYMILPTYPLPVDAQGTKVNFLVDESWLPEKYRPLLRAGREFRRELGMRSSIPAVSIFGYGLKTISNLNLQRDANGAIKKIDYRNEPSGDSTVLEFSTVLDGSEIHPVQQYHGSLFVDNDVKMRLKLELTRPAAG
jgi:pSer/pThr/pTyr-binding forkhead associated (FHA) protein